MGEMIDKPPLGADVYEDISREQYQVDRMYWAQLQPLRISSMAQLVTVAIGEPSLPRQRIRLCEILRKYSSALFDAEACRYPASSDLECWLRNLAERIERRILSIVPNPLFGSLTYHATEEQMQTAVREALEGRTRSYVATFKVGMPDTVPEVVLPANANPPSSFEPSSSLEGSRPRAPRAMESAKLEGIARAQMVRTVKQELDTIRPDLFSRKDIDALKARYPNFVVFEVCSRHPTLIASLENLQSTKQYVWLAIKIAASKVRKAEKTIESDWRRYKKFLPPEAG